MIDIIKPNWVAPEHIHAFTTTRSGGYSEEPYASLNLANHVGDKQEDVDTNRALIKEVLDLPNEPTWLEQVHGTKIICADAPPTSLQADGSFAKLANKVCIVLTADCLPVLLTNKKGTIVAALHAGWRSMVAGIIENGVEICNRENEPLIAWLGPAIGPDVYEVGAEVRQQFIDLDKQAEQAFIPSENNRWLANLYLLAKQRLEKMGVSDIFGGDYCTYTDAKRFFSHRRDGTTGRMATMIWMGRCC